MGVAKHVQVGNCSLLSESFHIFREMSDSEDFSGSEDGKFKFKQTFDLSELPQEVQKRVKALKNIQFANIKHEVEYYHEIHKLDLKYQKLYDENNVKRKQIYQGEYEPTALECEWKESDAADAVIDKLEKLEVDDKNLKGGNVKGIPNFWLTVFQNSNETLLSGTFEQIDEPVLKHLEDITITLPEKNTGFTLNFHFAPNEFFTNTVLTKEYELKSDYDPEDPLEFDGPEMFRSKGCKIDWKSGKNTTVKVIKQKVKQKGKGKGGPKFVTKEEKRETFFNFFKPPKVPEDAKDEVDDEKTALITQDFDIGFSIKEKLVPRAVLYFTGEAIEDDDDDFEDESDEDDEDGDDD